MTDSRISKQDVSVLREGGEGAAVSKQDVSVLRKGTPGAATSKQVISALREGGDSAAVSKQVISVLRRVNQVLTPDGMEVEVVFGTPYVSENSIIQGAGGFEVEVVFGTPTLSNFTGDTENRTFDLPACNTEYVVPVQQGSVRCLTVAVSPGGKALFGWVDGTANEFRCAVTASPTDIFTDDVVEAGDVRTAYTPSAGRTLYVASMFVEGGDLFAVVSDFIGGAGAPNGTIKCLIADDPENPVTWSLRGTVQSTSGNPGGGMNLDECREGGVPTVLDNGRWVLPHQTWRGHVINAVIDGVGVFTSDDRGANWAVRLSFRTPPLLSSEAGPQSTSIARQPSTGLLLFGSHIGPTGNTRVFISSDNGTSWSDTTDESGSTKDFYMDDGVDVYATLPDSGTRYIYRVDDPAVASTWTQLCAAVEHGAFTHEDGFYSIPLFLDGNFYRMAFTAGDRIGAYRLGGWLIGRIGGS